MKLLFGIITWMLLVVQGASPLTFHTGYSQSAWEREKAPKLMQVNGTDSRPGLRLAVSHTFPHRWANVRLGIASAARGARSTPFTVIGTRGGGVNIHAVEMSALVEYDLPVAYLIAGPYVDIRTSCSGDRSCSRMSRTSEGIQYGIGIRYTYKVITAYLEGIRHQGLRSAMTDNSYSYNRGFLIQVGIQKARQS